MVRISDSRWGRRIDWIRYHRQEHWVSDEAEILINTKQEGVSQKERLIYSLQEFTLHGLRRNEERYKKHDGSNYTYCQQKNLG